MLSNIYSMQDSSLGGKIITADVNRSLWKMTLDNDSLAWLEREAYLFVDHHIALK